MRSKLLILAVAVAATLVSCNRHESVTGSYGGRVVAGQIVMASEMVDRTPAGVEVTVVGTGMSTTLAADGRFTFVGVPEDAELSFRRADGVDARFRVGTTGSALVIEVSGLTAKSSSRRRGVAPANQYEGIVRAISDDFITVFDSHRNEVKIALDSSTLIRKGNQTLTAADVKVDDRVHVSAIMKNDVLTAVQVIVQQQEGPGDDDHGGTTMTANGAVRSVSGTTLVVASQPHGDVTVKTDASTIIKKQGQRITVADIRRGDEVNCLGTRVDEHTLMARQIEVRGNSKRH